MDETADFATFAELIEITRRLRGPGGCPWDREQTHRTLTRFAIEEAYEWAMAVERGDAAEMRGELGDLLFQVALNAEIAREAGQFTLGDVLRALNEKMVRRHPHVFGGSKAATSTEVMREWARIKALEKPAGGGAPKPMFDIPLPLPALIRAQKIGEKTLGHDFDFEGPAAAWEKVTEELGELGRAATADETRAELGDLLFSLAQWARHVGLDAEQALREANHRFETRFVYATERAASEGRDWAGLDAAEKRVLWERAKVATAP